MDINGDGINDILSGCYSRQDNDMAGLFWVLEGKEKGGFAAPRQLNGDDGKPLIISPAQGAGDAVIEKICTRPFAGDLDGDGHLDLVVGNFGGHFYFFAGKGKGVFSAKSTPLQNAKGKTLKVDHHSDPFLVDWDGDGDLDLLSGSNSGGAFLFPNEGSAKKAAFGKRQTLLAAARAPSIQQNQAFGEAHIKGPQGATRVWAADMNGDGRLDLVLGDSFTINTPADGLDEKTARARYAEAEKAMAADQKRMRDAFDKGEEFNEEIDWQKHYEAMQAAIKSTMTGSVWVLYQN